MPSLRLRPGDHVVHFYRDDDELSATVVSELGTALLDGAAAVIVATPRHRARLCADLAEFGVPVQAKQRDGSLVVLDAADTLAKFTGADGRMDRTCFADVIGSVIRSAGTGGRAVHAYGEMVALLWAAGDVGGVLDLECLWNELFANVPFSLMCGYPAGSMTDPDATATFADICRVHTTTVLPTPSPIDAEVTRHFPQSAVAPGAARRFTNDWLDASGHADLAHAAALAVSELATNAVRHAHSDFTVSLSRLAPGVRMTVGDRSTVPPQLRPGDVTTTGGRGLLLVDALSAGWGYQLVAGGKLVWVDIPVG